MSAMTIYKSMVGLCAARQVRQPFECPPWLYVKALNSVFRSPLNASLRLTYVVFIHGITLSIDAVDSMLMLRVAPTNSAFSTDW